MVVPHEMMLAAQVLELCNEAAFLASKFGQIHVAALATSAAIGAGAFLGLSQAQVMRMQAELSVERTRITTMSEKRLRQTLKRTEAKSAGP